MFGVIEALVGAATVGGIEAASAGNRQLERNHTFDEGQAGGSSLECPVRRGAERTARLQSHLIFFAFIPCPSAWR